MDDPLFMGMGEGRAYLEGDGFGLFSWQGALFEDGV